MSWTWEHPLKTIVGAKVKVQTTSWAIEKYFPGPDGRYNGTFWRLSSREVAPFAQALLDCWVKLQRTKLIAPPEGEFKIIGPKNIWMIVRGWPGPGITLYDHLGLLESHQKVLQVHEELMSLEKMAVNVQESLA